MHTRDTASEHEPSQHRPRPVRRALVRIHSTADPESGTAAGTGVATITNSTASATPTPSTPSTYRASTPPTPATPTVTTKTSYTTTVLIPSNAKTVHPTDHSQPPMDPPAAAREHSANGAGAFAAWYTRWLLYAYIARTKAPLAEHSDNCLQCNEVISHVQDLISEDQTFSGEIFAVQVIGADRYAEASAEIIVKWANAGYRIIDAQGAVIHEFKGGEGYYMVRADWLHGEWKTKQIATVNL